MTTELIKTTGITLNGDKITAVNARDLWKFLESKQDFSTWIKRRIEKYEFIEGQDYLLHKFVEQLPSGAKHCIEYLISLDMAKELAMVENNERGRQARQYFIEVEKRFRHAGNLVEAIRAALTPIIRENEQYRARLELARNFLPNGNPGDLNRAGLPLGRASSRHQNRSSRRPAQRMSPTRSRNRRNGMFVQGTSDRSAPELRLRAVAHDRPSCRAARPGMRIRHAPELSPPVQGKV